MEEYNKSYGANNHTSLLSHAQSQSPDQPLWQQPGKHPNLYTYFFVRFFFGEKGYIPLFKSCELNFSPFLYFSKRNKLRNM